jgi:hypothetical protein
MEYLGPFLLVQLRIWPRFSRFLSQFKVLINFLTLSRQRHVVEMLNMAQRPYSSVILDVTNDAKITTETSPKARLKARMSANHAPVAIETTADNCAAVCTIFIRLPGQKRKPVCLGSALIVQPKESLFLNKPTGRIAQQNL